ncbi:hypothetical protein FACS1894159_01030 [Bacteroidia bacterium]|nr:hypothetical protein FACS1894159_01030 [Bacteroidia bacterium]
MIIRFPCKAIAALMLLLATVAGCKKDDVARTADLTLSEARFIVDHQGAVKTFRIETDGDWSVFTLMTLDNNPESDWIDIEPRSGRGNAMLTVMIAPNTLNRDRELFIEISTSNGITPTILPVSVMQEGTLGITTNPEPVGILNREATLGGKWIYDYKEMVAEAGIEYRHGSSSDYIRVPAGEITTQEFHVAIPDLEYWDNYYYRAYAVRASGEVVFGDVAQFSIIPKTTYGTIAVEGILKSTIAASGVKIKIPYYLGKDTGPRTVSATCSEPSLTVAGKQVTIDGDGTVWLDVAGTPPDKYIEGDDRARLLGLQDHLGEVMTRPYEVTFTIHGLEDEAKPDNPFTVNATVIRGGAGIILYGEDFGKLRSDFASVGNKWGDSWFSYYYQLPWDDPSGKGVVYSKSSPTGPETNLMIRYEDTSYSAPYDLWAQAGSALAPRIMEFTISNLNFEHADNLHMSFTSRRNGNASNEKYTWAQAVKLYYSTDNGLNWTQLTHDRAESAWTVKTKTNVTAPIPAVANLAIRFSFSFETQVSSYDDMIITGDVL